MATKKISVVGPAGAIEVALDFPEQTARGTDAARGLALVAHPHPLFGGTMENKVAQTLARSFVQLGYISARPNFRGVGGTAGVHDEGVGETDDLLAVIAHLQAEYRLDELVLGGFSFGAFVQTRVAARLSKAGTAPLRIVLVGTSVGRQIESVPQDTLVIHGELDETVELAKVLDWARPQELPVIVIPGADHFFHRRLTIIKRLVLASWRGMNASQETDDKRPE